MLLDQVCGERGHFTAEELDEVLRPGSVYAAPTTLVSMENTHNFAGGTVWDIDRYRAVAARAHEAGARVHVDGARLFNAAVAGCRRDPPETNIVFFDPPSGLAVDDFVTRLVMHDIRMGQVLGRVRAVTHLDVATADIDTTISAVNEIAGLAVAD